MCKFCENIANKKFVWSTRSTMADDNLNDYLWDNSDGEENWVTGLSEFSLIGYEHNEQVWIGVDYHQEIEDHSHQDNGTVTVYPFSETIPISYCPFCGKQLTVNVKRFEDIPDDWIKIEDE